MKHLVLWVLAASALSACEPNFTGRRPVNVTELNAPMQMKTVTVDSTPYLAVMNTNHFNKYDNSTLQFFNITTPSSPTRVAGLSVKLPSHSSDFLYDAPNLYVLDPSRAKLLVYQYSSGSFSEKKDSRGVPIQIPLADNPQRIIKVTLSGGEYGGSVLAITCQTSATIFFIRVNNSGAESSDFVFVPDVSTFGTKDVKLFGSKVGVSLFMNPRQTVSGTDDRITLGGADREGLGINPISFIGDSNYTFVTAGYRSPGIFAYRLKDLTNSSNFAWDLGRYRDGYMSGATQIHGSQEYGFRGLAADPSGTIYFSSSADEKVYSLSWATLNQSKVTAGTETVATRNTRGFDEAAQTYALSVSPDFDSDTTDRSFPALGNLVIDCPPNDTFGATTCDDATSSASKLWVLGTSSNRVYRVDLKSGTPMTMTASGAILSGPQQLLWHSSGILYIANSAANTISIVDGASLALTGIGTIPTVN